MSPIFKRLYLTSLIHSDYRVLQAILESRAQVVCMQEVDLHHYRAFFGPILATVGVSSVFRPKPVPVSATSTDKDGCMIAFRGDLSLSSTASVVLCAMNQVLLTTEVSVPVAGDSVHVLICTTHLKSSKTADGERVREDQVRHVVEFLSTCHTDIHSTPYQRIVLCGDFNALPHTTSHITYAPLAVPLMKQHLQDCYDEVCLNVSASEHDNHTFNSNDVEKKLEDQRTNSYDEHYTTMKTRKGGLLKHTIDYIFHSKNNARTVAVREVPQSSQFPEYGLPDWRWPSDHLSLQAWLVFD